MSDQSPRLDGVSGFTECDREAIHLPGSIQSFGVLLVVDAELIIRQCSENIGRLCGLPADEILELPARTLFPESIVSELRTLVDGPPQPIGVLPSTDSTRSWRVFGHRRDGLILIECVPLFSTDQPMDLTALAIRLSEDQSIEIFAGTVCQELKRLTGYDRVMVYRFDPQWNGEVIAEAKEELLDPYLGLHYPAGDIPIQARQLYLETQIRLLPDTQAPAIQLSPDKNPITDRPLDLSHALLRTMSPVHLEYLANMQVRSTLVTSIVVDGQLWGLIVCHHRTPRGPDLRWPQTTLAAAKLLVTATTLDHARQRTKGIAFAQSMMRSLPQLLAGQSHLGEGLIDPRSGLMELFAADGLAVVHRGDVYLRGEGPSPQEMTHLVSWLESIGLRFFETDCLADCDSSFAGLITPGVIALSIPNSLRGWVLWFRLEHQQTVTWAGDPRKAKASHANGSGRLAPRESFAKWVEIVSGRSRPWSRFDRETAEEVIRPNLLEVVTTVYEKQAAVLRRYQSILFDQVHDAIIVTDLDGVITFWNEGAERTLGWTAQEMVGRPILDRIPEKERADAAALFANVRDGQPFAGRYRDTHKDGRAVWLDIRLRRIHDESGRFIGLMGASRDVTAEKIAEDKLRLKQAIVRQARDSILVTDAETVDAPGPRIVYANPSLLENTGYTLEELIGQTPRIFQGPKTDLAALSRIRNALKNWQPVREEVINYRKDGSEFWVELDISPLADETGWFTHWIGVQRDVTERKQAEAALREREGAFRSLAENSPDPVFVIDPDSTEVPYRILFTNHAIRNTHGFEPSEVIGRSMLDLDDSHNAKLAPARAQRIVEGETLFIEVVHHDRQGQPVPMEVHATLIEWNGRRAILSLNRDLRERLKSETTIRRERAFFRQVIDTVPSLICARDSERRYTLVNQNLASIFGKRPEELLHHVDSDFDTNPQPVDPTKCHTRIEADGQLHEQQYRLADGTFRWVAITKSPLRFEDSDQTLCVATDITARREAEQRIHDQLKIFSAGPAVLMRLSATCPYRIVNVTPNISQFGWAVEQCLADDFAWARLIHPDDRHQMKDEFETALANRVESLELRYRMVTPGNEPRWVLNYLIPVSDETGRITFADGYLLDITSLKNAEAALQQSDERYRTLAENIADVISLHDPDGRVLYVSPSNQKITGLPSDALIGRLVTDRIHPDDRAKLAETFATNSRGESGYTEWRLRKADDAYLWVETTTRPVMNPNGSVHSVICSTRDISLRKSLEDKVRQVQKLEAIGQLAGGVAHDFNNLLTVVTGNADLILAELPKNHPHRAYVDSIRRAGDRGAALTRQLLAFGRQQMLRIESISPITAVRDTMSMLKRLLGEDVVVKLDLDPDTGTILADAGQFEQIIINLAVNARDAMPKGGRLSVGTRRVKTDDGRDWVLLSVGDSGSGIPPEIRSKLFEPFFTTKPVGQGTGLGLATVYGIVQQLNGFITFDSDLGVGTQFHIHIPRHSQPVAEKTRSKLELNTPNVLSQSRTVLVVEDDESVRFLTTAILERSGYQVLTAESGAQALEICEQRTEPPDIVMTDVVMPGMNGRELAEELLKRYPGLKVIFLSGYTADTVVRYGVEHEHVSFLQKPYTPDSLTNFVSQMLA